ncbi:MAG: hypothetical protein M1839_003347 [Geoglossum umbratile]|nr:MAG: hypothetical protein M1839_003347 [Geoglossum umbratile]
MAGKLDQSLDEILSTQRRTANRPSHGRRHKGSKDSAAPAASPVGGVKKNTKASNRGGRTSVPTGPSAGSVDGKIIVSNLPADVNETQVKDYFSNTVGPVKKVLITYGPNGVSRGIATVIFNRAVHANRALEELNGILVDGRPMKVEMVLDAARAPPPVPAKTLSERVAQPKGQPKPATVTKSSGGVEGARGRAARGRGRGRGRNAGRPKPKTADELDAEMADYWGPTGQPGVAGANTTANSNGAGQPAATNGSGDVGMDDEGDVL